jgi:hypothetical protein
MPLSHSRLHSVVAALFGSFLLVLAFASVADAAKSKTVLGDLRVVDGKGKLLAEQTQYTGPGQKIKTDPKATCFGPDDGGSGAKVEIPGPTGLSLLADAGGVTKSVKPLSLTDAFSFGLGLCGIGNAVSPDTGFWALKVNHEASQSGGDATEVGSGDEVLWYLVNDFNAPPPEELVLKTKKFKGGKLPVQVLSYDDAGKKKPAVGAEISGFDGVTDAKGKITLSLEGSKVVDLTATLEGAIPSNEVSVCTVEAKKCPAGYAGIVGGTKGDDKIKVDSSVTVLCGGGKDKVTVTGEAKIKAKGCEKVQGVA